MLALQVWLIGALLRLADGLVQLGSILLAPVLIVFWGWELALFRMRKAGYWPTCTYVFPSGARCGHSRFHLGSHVGPVV